MGSVIIGSGKSLPARIVTNDELGQIVDTTDEWIVPRTGIHTRAIAVHETGTDLGAEAALRALGQAEGGWQREKGAIDAASLDMIICPTLTPDAAFPSQAALIRERIGAVNAVCYDMSCACSGCVYGTSTADMLLAASAADIAAAKAAGRPPRRNPLRRILVVATERLSRLVDWDDRATCILFGDGAGAVVMEWREDADGMLSSYMENTDDADHVLWCDSAFCDRPLPFDAVSDEAARAAAETPCDPYMRMAGQAVFKFATSAMVRCIEEALSRAQLSPEDVALYVPHQANERIIKYAAKKLGIGLDRFQVSLASVGNTSASSVLMALADAYQGGRIEPGDAVMLVGFGGGLTAGALLYRA